MSGDEAALEFGESNPRSSSSVVDDFFLLLLLLLLLRRGRFFFLFLKQSRLTILSSDIDDAVIIAAWPFKIGS